MHTSKSKLQKYSFAIPFDEKPFSENLSHQFFADISFGNDN
jgi:hypothetical protein